MLTAIRSAAAVAALAIFTAPLSAATLTSLGGVADVDASQSLATPGYSWNGAPSVQTDNARNQYLSPFDGTGDFGAGYYALRRGETATLEADGVSNSLSLLWGSIDDSPTWNLISFYLNGSLVDAVSGENVVDAGLRAGPTIIEISDVTFDAVVFSASSNAFEFSNVSVAPVPLPASGLLLLVGMGGVVLLRRRAQAA